MSSLDNEGSVKEIQTGSETPLSDQERAILQRLLSDPLSYPQQFKTWLVTFLEGSDMLLSRSSVQGLTSMLGSGGGGSMFALLPAGLIFPIGGDTPPLGTLLCDGGIGSRVTHSRLFAAIGTKWGAGDGSTTFGLPDFRRRFLLGAGPSYPAGQTDGQPVGTRDPKHHHHVSGSVAVSVSGGTSGGGHEHNVHYTMINAFNSADTNLPVVQTGTGGSSTPTSGGGGHSHGVTASGSGTYSDNTTGGGLQDIPAYATVNYVINY
jgi:microcystin-dependent protein